MYEQIINKIRELGDLLPAVSGKVNDLATKKTLVTEWDIRIEKELSDLIRTFPGNHSVFAEEISNTYIENENVWIMDPISNTFNFVHGLPHYTIVVSHLHKGEVIFAAVYDPSTQEMFSAEKGKGAQLNNVSIHVSSNEGKVALMIGPHINPGNLYALKILKIMEHLSSFSTMRTFGSVGLHYAYVACGRVEAAITKNSDVFPEFAGKLLVEEAGGIFTDFDGEGLTLTSKSSVASNGLVHKKILEGITEALK
jgi:myo-inositol-1(or 4)-monophosphatase